MTTSDNWFTLMAQYNRWMNSNLHAAASALDAECLNRQTGAYFGSILGTLNHIATGDTIWMRRFAGHPTLAADLHAMAQSPQPTRLDEAFFPTLEAWWAYRQWLDKQIDLFACRVGGLPPDMVLEYASLKGIPGRRSLQALAMHFFNHQTHHRGQVTALLMQAGVDPGVTDLLALLPEVPACNA